MIRVMLIGVLIQISLVFAAQASDGYLSGKHSEKKRVGWTLQEWLEMKERNQLMDQWLMLNSAPDIYEFYLGLEPDKFLDSDGKTHSTSGQIQLAAYATLAGLSGSYLIDGTGWDGSFRLRLLGGSDQNTNITLEYGLRSRTLDNTKYDAMAAAAHMTLNLTGSFGLIGSYRHIFESHNIESKDSPTPTALEAGDEWRIGLFIDFKFLRIYGQWFNEPDAHGSTREGAIGGIRLYF